MNWWRWIIFLGLSGDAAARQQATCNLDSWYGRSVLDLIRAFETVNRIAIPYEIVARRPGDVALYYADPAFAALELGWRTKRPLDDMCRDAWRWQQQNPWGYSCPQSHNADR